MCWLFHISFFLLFFLIFNRQFAVNTAKRCFRSQTSRFIWRRHLCDCFSLTFYFFQKNTLWIISKSNEDSSVSFTHSLILLMFNLCVYLHQMQQLQHLLRVFHSDASGFWPGIWLISAPPESSGLICYHFCPAGGPQQQQQYATLPPRSAILWLFGFLCTACSPSLKDCIHSLPPFPSSIPADTCTVHENSI